MTDNTVMIIILIWMAVMSLILFFSMGSDKKRAQRKEYRIPEKRLFLFAFLGGALGGWLGMAIFHHKTKHWYFALGFPAITLIQAALLVYWYFFR